MRSEGHHHDPISTGRDMNSVLNISSKQAYNDVNFDEEEISVMRTTLTIDDDVFAKAAQLTGLKEKSSLVRAAFDALIASESARRLAALGGTEPELEAISRRQSDRG